MAILSGYLNKMYLFVYKKNVYEHDYMYHNHWKTISVRRQPMYNKMGCPLGIFENRGCQFK